VPDLLVFVIRALRAVQSFVFVAQQGHAVVYVPRVIKAPAQGQPRYAFSVKEDMLESVDKALLALKSGEVTKSFSELICEAIIAYAKQRGVGRS
jgi:hypothetical protein